MKLYMVKFYYKCKGCGEIIATPEYYFTNKNIKDNLADVVNAVAHSKDTIQVDPNGPYIAVSESEYHHYNHKTIDLIDDLQFGEQKQHRYITSSIIQTCRAQLDGMLAPNMASKFVHELVGYWIAESTGYQSGILPDRQYLTYGGHLCEGAAECNTLEELLNWLAQHPYTGIVPKAKSATPDYQYDRAKMADLIEQSLTEAQKTEIDASQILTHLYMGKR